MPRYVAAQTVVRRDRARKLKRFTGVHPKGHMEWLEQLKLNAPYVVLLGTGIVTVWRAYLAKDAALAAAQEARINDLKAIVAEASKD